MSGPSFIHLRLHTEYSLLEGAVRLKSLPGLCVKSNMPAVAVTDTNNMFAALEFSVSAQDAGVQPIVGCQIDVQYQQAGLGEAETKPGGSTDGGALGLGNLTAKDIFKMENPTFTDRFYQLEEGFIRSVFDATGERLPCLPVYKVQASR